MLLSGKESACQCRRCRKRGFDPWVRKIPWRKKWQPTPVFLPRKSHGQRSLEGYSPCGQKESNMTSGKFHEQRAWWATVHGVARVRHNQATELQPHQEALAGIETEKLSPPKLSWCRHSPSSRPCWPLSLKNH